ncbi:MAG TPA: tetratricopeptide repeat protein [Thermoanaerobaculia bacterium]|nr:tetratricopeptide repeat protein [Thermoanaerobaculia bacterium]
MRIRTFVGVLVALGLVVLVSYLTVLNREVLAQPFDLAGLVRVPLYSALLVVFGLGFLPPATSLLVGTVKRELALRDERRKAREAESLQASFRRGVDFQSAGQLDKAASELAVVVDGRPEDFPALLRYGEVLRQLGRVGEAIDLHQRLAVLFPANVAPLYQLAEDYDSRGEPEVAREICNRILRDFPQAGLAVLLRRRNAAIVASQFERATLLQEEINALREGLPVSAEEERIGLGLTYQRGVAELEADRVHQAIEIFRSVLAREPRFIPAILMLGEAELVRDDEDAAVEQWLAGYRETGNPVFLQRLEDHQIEGEDPRRAIEMLRRLIAESKNDLVPRFFLGRLYDRLEMHEDALKLYQSIGDRVASSPTYHFLIARIHERRGDVTRALDAYHSLTEQLGLPSYEYRCRVCSAPQPEWRDRCDRCGSWNCVELDFEEEHVTLEALGVKEAPVWEVPAGWDARDLADEGAK